MSAINDTQPTPPTARRDPHRLAAHGETRVDPYYWMREREDPDVLAYLEAENAYTADMLAHTEPLQAALFEEIKGRIKQDDETVPVRHDGFYYYTRFEDERAYPIYCRKAGSLEADEEVLVDVNTRAEGHTYLSIPSPSPSPAHDVLAFAEDAVGRRIYTLRFKDLRTGELLPDEIGDVTGNVAWAADNETLLYTRQHPETLRWYQVWRHTLGTDPADDVLVYEEADPQFRVWVYRTQSKRFLVLLSRQTEQAEARVIPADDPTAAPRVLLEREPGHEFEVDHLAGHFYVRTNDGARDFRLTRLPEDAAGKAAWTEVVPGREDVLLERFELFDDYLVTAERHAGLPALVVRPWSDPTDGNVIAFDEPAYDAYIGANPEPDSTVLRFHYSSMTTPDSTYDYHMATGERVLRKRKEVLGGFDPSSYRTERLHATAPDGERVPISLVYRRGLFRRDGTAPLLLYGYGSYGISMEASFRSPRLSLIDRGFVYAIAHVRGGEELGRRWYDAGRLEHKPNTFTDFIACAERLIKAGYADQDRLFAMGGSAGGLLMGAVVNMRPDLFRGVVAHVPFVDVVTTMLDDSIPLTTGEYREWGNPNNEADYRTMLAYSPYDNIRPQAYPDLLVTSGLHDSQVQYWEPTKWVAKLRANATGDGRLLLKTNLEAGHSGASGRYERYEELALHYAFLIDLAGAPETPALSADEEPPS